MQKLQNTKHQISNTQGGITLVALIITIIILLVLATVSINIVMNGGVINKAKLAVDKYSDEEVGEQIKLTYLEYETEKLYKTNTDVKDFMEQSLEKIYGVGKVTVTPKNNIEKFPMIVSINGISYDLLSNGKTEKRADYETLESLYGTVVSGYTGYSATDITEWKLLYVDEENRDAIIIASGVTDRKGPLLYKNSNNQEYSGYQDVASFEYGRNYNGLWLDLCEEPDDGYNEKTTAYLCDPNNWTAYVTGKAKYAAGGPTFELLFASRYDKQIKDFKDPSYTGLGSSIRNVNRTGYEDDRRNGFSTSVRNQLYNNSNRYYIASPDYGHKNYSPFMSDTADYIHSGGLYSSWESEKYSYRPIVCLPVSAIGINGTGENMTLEYK